MKLAGSEGEVDNVGTSMDEHSVRSQVGMVSVSDCAKEMTQ